MSQPTRLDALAEELAAILRNEHDLSVTHESLVVLLAERRDSVASTLRIQPHSALRYLDTGTIRDLAATIAAAVTPPATTLDDLDPDAPVNCVSCAHYEPAADGLPALHLTPAGLLADDMLPALLAAPQVCLAVEDPHPDCAPEHRAVGPHQQLRLHLNAGLDYGHDDCLVASACVGCMTVMFDAITAHHAGWVRRYIPQGHRWVGQARFRLVNIDPSIAAIDAARARLTPA